jgi:hypothetical protein
MIILPGNFKGQDRARYLALDGSIALKAILCKFGVKFMDSVYWFRLGSKKKLYGYGGESSVLHRQGIS